MALVSQGTTLTWNTNAVGEIVDINGPTSTRDEIDSTNLGSTAKEFQLALVDNGTLSMTVNCKPADLGQEGLEGDFNTDPPPSRAVLITLPIDTDQSHSTATTLAFNARCSGFELAVATDAIVQINVSLRLTGAVTWTWGAT